MTAFTAWKFDTPEGADHASSLLEAAEADQLVKVMDHAVVSWPQGEKNPKASHGHDDTARGAGWGALWGLLFGALFAVPVLGLAAGGAIGALSKASREAGHHQGAARGHPRRGDRGDLRACSWSPSRATSTGWASGSAAPT